MSKKTIKYLFIIVTILYIIIGGLLFINIQVMESPEIIIDIEVSEITPEKAVLQTNIDIYNPNSFDILVKNLKVSTTASDGYRVADVEIAGGKIASNGKKTFTKDVIIAFAGHSPEVLTSVISGDVGMSVLFIEKTIPLNVGVVTSLEKVLNEIDVPSISATIDIKEFSTEEIKLSAIIDVYNPNSFEIYIENVTGEIKNEKGKKIGELDVLGGTFSPKESLEINTTGWMLLEAFNSEEINFVINGIAGAKIAGFEKNLSFSVETRLIIPDLEELILSKDKPVLLSIKANNKLTLKGLITVIDLEVKNTYKVDLTIRDITCRLYTVVDDELNLLGENTIDEELIAEVGQIGTASCEIIIPFSKIITNFPSSEWLMVSATARLTVKGINPSIYVEIRGYTDIRVLK